MARQRPKALKRASADTTWIPKAIELVRELNGMGIEITISSYASATGYSEDLAESRLRELTQRGWLHMSAPRDKDGNFLGFKWDLR